MFGKKNNYINLTEKEKKQLMKNMTGKQKKEKNLYIQFIKIARYGIIKRSNFVILGDENEREKSEAEAFISG